MASGAPVKISILGDAKEAVRAFDRAGGAAVDASRDFDRAGDAAVKSGKDFDKVADAAGDTASASSQVAGGLGDVAGAASALGLISEDTAAKVGTWSEGIMGLTGVADLAEVAVGKLKIGTIASTVATKAQAAAQRVLNTVMKANPIGLIVTAIALLVGGLILAYKKSDTFRRIVDRAFSIVKRAGKALWNGLQAAFDGIKKAMGKVVDFAGTLKSKITDGFTAVVDFIKGVPGKIRDLGSKFKEAGASIMGKIIDGIKNAAGFIGNIASGIWNAVKGLLNGAIGKINAALEFKISLPLGKSITINPPDIPLLAKGGIVTGPTLAVIGEAGPEAVVPLNGRYGMGNTYRIDVTVAPTASPTETGRQIVRAIEAYESNGGRRRAS